MRLMLRSCLVNGAVLALVLAAGGTAYGVTPDEPAAAVPARPAGARDLPPSRVRIDADVTWGIADPRAVDAFRRIRLRRAFSTFLTSAPSTYFDHAGRGYWLIGDAPSTFGAFAPKHTFGAYANHTVYRKQREPGNPAKFIEGWLYAPTMFGPGADCIEAVTVVQNQAPQVWAWDWCNGVPRALVVVVVDHKFERNYIRMMPDGLPEYTVETILASDGVTWDMVLYNYITRKWDIIYQKAGTRNPNYGLGQYGWEFFEIDANVNSGISNVCNPLRGPIAADQVSLSFDDQTFVPITPGDSAPLVLSTFYCNNFVYSTPHPDEWVMQYQSS